MNTIENNANDFVPLVPLNYSLDESISRSRSFYEFVNKRRTVRQFSEMPIPDEVLNNVLLTASSAPSGAHKQPWTFCVVTSSTIKKL